MLPQPDWHTCADFTRFGRPRLGFLVTAGVIDSMVNHYTAAKKPPRASDAYSPGGQAGHAPGPRHHRLSPTAFAQAYGNVPILPSAGWKPRCAASPTTITGTTACATPCLVDSGRGRADVRHGRARPSCDVAQVAGRRVSPCEKMRIPGTCVMAPAPPEGALYRDPIGGRSSAPTRSRLCPRLLGAVPPSRIPCVGQAPLPAARQPLSFAKPAR